MSATAQESGLQPKPSIQLTDIQLIRSVPWRVRDAAVVFLLPWVVLPLMLVAVLNLIAPNFPFAQSYLHSLIRGDTSAYFGLVIVDAIGSFAAIGYYLRRYKAGVDRLGLRPFSARRTFGYISLILLSFGILVSLAYWAAQAIDPHFNANQPQANQFTAHPSVMSLMALVFIPPLVEEPTFRGFIFPAFARRYGTVIGALVASVLFGVAHLQGNVSVYTFILSLLLCWLYTRVGSIIPGIGLHMLNNYIAYITLNQK